MGRIELVEEAPTQGRFSTADFADQDDEALLFTHALLEVLERLLVGRAEVKKPRVRGDIERHLAKPVQTLIHADSEGGARVSKRTPISRESLPVRIRLKSPLLAVGRCR